MAVVIPQNVLYIVLSVVFAIVIIIVVVQWRRVRETANSIKLAETQIQLKKISLVEKDLESKRFMEDVFPLPKEQQERLAGIRQNTAEVLHKVGYLHSEINERVTRLEARTEFAKLQSLMDEIEKKESDLQKQMKKKGGE
jgi:hypothetical protein